MKSLPLAAMPLGPSLELTLPLQELKGTTDQWEMETVKCLGKFNALHVLVLIAALFESSHH